MTSRNKLPPEAEGFTLFMMAVTFICVVVSTFGAVINLIGLTDRPWMVVFKPAILVFAADISLIVAAITFYCGLNIILTIWERLNK